MDRAGLKKFISTATTPATTPASIPSTNIEKNEGNIKNQVSQVTQMRLKDLGLTKKNLSIFRENFHTVFIILVVVFVFSQVEQIFSLVQQWFTLTRDANKDYKRDAKILVYIQSCLTTINIILIVVVLAYIGRAIYKTSKDLKENYSKK